MQRFRDKLKNMFKDKLILIDSKRIKDYRVYTKQNFL